MKKFSFKLLSATILAGTLASAANAQFAFDSAEIDGVGATSVQNVIVNVNSCIGDDEQLGVNNNSVATVTYGTYTGSHPLSCTGSGASNAANIYDSTGVYDGKYVATGSGTGRKEWSTFANAFATGTFPVGLGGGAFGTFPAAPWSHVQYAFSDSAATPADISTYNANANSATNAAGAAIQFPLFVFPVAFAYNPEYGYVNYVDETSKGTPLLFNITTPQSINGTVAGGMKLSRQNYCDIWNGTISNWNDGALVENQGGHSLMSASDTLSRWTSKGVPIRLVGRADKSGTTDLLSHALKAQCTVSTGHPNNFTKAREALPYNASSGINITTYDATSIYTPTGYLANNYAGDTNEISGIVYDRSATGGTGFCAIGSVTSPGNCGSFPADLIPTAGQFIVASGSGGVRDAVFSSASNALLDDTASGDPTIKLNGKFGYISGDFIKPSPSAILFAAALQEGGAAVTTKTKYLMPSTANATTAFGTVLPPQAKKSGKTSSIYFATDKRVVYNDLTNTANGGTAKVDRAIPTHWVNILYPPATKGNLELPTKGYPVTGPSNFLTYTCFSTDGKRSAISNLVGYLTGSITKRNSGAALDTTTFTGTTTAALGILTKSNFALVPGSWIAAINETFLSNSAAVGSKNLWIQSVQPVASQGEATSNPTCTVGKGA